VPLARTSDALDRRPHGVAAVLDHVNARHCVAARREALHAQARDLLVGPRDTCGSDGSGFAADAESAQAVRNRCTVAGYSCTTLPLTGHSCSTSLTGSGWWRREEELTLCAQRDAHCCSESVCCTERMNGAWPSENFSSTILLLYALKPGTATLSLPIFPKNFAADPFALSRSSENTFRACSQMFRRALTIQIRPNVHETKMHADGRS
jgi:hypothetical protein